MGEQYRLKCGEPQEVRGVVLEYKPNGRIYSTGLPEEGQKVLRKREVNKNIFGVQKNDISLLFAAITASPDEVLLDDCGFITKKA